MKKLGNNIEIKINSDGYFILDKRKGKYWHLDKLGGEILESLVDGINEENIAHQISSKYDVPKKQVQQDILKLTDELMRNGLLMEE